MKARDRMGVSGASRNCRHTASMPSACNAPIALRLPRPCSHRSRRGPSIQRRIGSVNPPSPGFSGAGRSSGANAVRNRCLSAAPGQSDAGGDGEHQVEHPPVEHGDSDLEAVGHPVHVAVAQEHVPLVEPGFELRDVRRDVALVDSRGRRPRAAGTSAVKPEFVGADAQGRDCASTGAAALEVQVGDAPAAGHHVDELLPHGRS